MKAYELLKEQFENRDFTDGLGGMYKVLRNFGGDLDLYRGEDNFNNPCKFTIRQIQKFDFKSEPVHFIKAIASEKDIYIKHNIYNKYEDDYLPLNVILKRISSFEPSVIKDIFANGEWYIKID
jgi:hypothetical protein